MVLGLLLVATLLDACSSESSGSGSALSAKNASASGSLSPSPSSSHEAIPGRVTGRVGLHDAVWGDLVVITSVTYNVGFESNCGKPHLRVVVSSGRTKLSRDWKW